MRERSYVAFRRATRLPIKSEADKAEIALDNGALPLTSFEELTVKAKSIEIIFN